MSELARHDGVVRQAFGLAIRGQLVDFPEGVEIKGADQGMRDAIDAAGADVAWDDDATEAEADVGAEATQQPRRRGRPPKA